MLRWALLIGAVLIAIPATLALVGVFLPRGHVASRTVTLQASPEKVFALISNIDGFTSWRSDLKSVERLPDDGKGVRFREKTSSGDVPFRIEMLQPPMRMVTRIADPSLPFGGTWTFELRPRGTNTELTITEDGEVYNVFFRTMQTLFFSPYKTIDTYQADLAKALH